LLEYNENRENDYKIKTKRKGLEHMISITEYLQKIFEDFKEEIECGRGSLCDLKKLTFEAGELPNYKDIQIQRLYLLRYAFAYAFEYTKMYEKVLEDMGNPTEIAVASIGCGNMIDYWALVQAIENSMGLNCDVKYVGVDEIDWAYKFPIRSQDKVEYYLENAKTCFDGTRQLASDVYFFPKSISEFTENEMKDIVAAFRNKPIVKDTIYLCISIRKNEHSQEIDIHRTEQIYRALLDNGFRPDSDYDVYTHYTNNAAICLYDENYIYPNDALDYLKHLSEKCDNYVNTGKNCYYGCNYLNRQPVLRNGMICYQVIKFERV